MAGGGFAVMLALLFLLLARESPARPEPSIPAMTSAGGEAPPDISQLSPRERFNRLYNRVMRAAQAGDEATASRFTPMALSAYEMLDSLDADARYHAALLHAHRGSIEQARALGDTILTRDPGHLLGYVVLGTAARWRKDDAELRRAYTGFLGRYEAEMKAARPEYTEHRFSIDEFRRAAESGARPDAGS